MVDGIQGRICQWPASIGMKVSGPRERTELAKKTRRSRVYYVPGTNDQAVDGDGPDDIGQAFIQPPNDKIKRRLQKLEAAENLVRKHRNLAEKEPEQWRFGLARALMMLAHTLSEDGQHKEAIEQVEDAISIVRGLVDGGAKAHEPALESALKELDRLRSLVDRDQSRYGPTEETSPKAKRRPRSISRLEKPEPVDPLKQEVTERNVAKFVRKLGEILKNPEIKVPWIEDLFPIKHKRIEASISEIDAQCELTARFVALTTEDKLKALAVVEQDHTEPGKYDSVPLWSDRSSGREVTPVDFIKANYGRTVDGEWDSEGLTLADLRRDKPLYNAYVQRIRRIPDEDLGLPAEHARKRIDDPEEAIERRRASSRATYHRTKTL